MEDIGVRLGRVVAATVGVDDARVRPDVIEPLEDRGSLDGPELLPRARVRHRQVEPRVGITLIDQGRVEVQEHGADRHGHASAPIRERQRSARSSGAWRTETIFVRAV